MCKSISSEGSIVKHSQILSHKFSRVYTSPVSMKLDARKYITVYLIEDEFFSCFSGFIFCSKQMADNYQPK